MKLPNAEQAAVEREKIADYLLNPAHPDNAGKAPFFMSLGFHSDDWLVLAEALCKLAAATEVTRRHDARNQVCSRRSDGDTGRQDAEGAHDLDCGSGMGQTAHGHCLSIQGMKQP